MKKTVLLSVFLCLSQLVFVSSENELKLIGASGIARFGDFLLFVCDKDPGAYYKYPIEGQTGPRIKIDKSKLTRIAAPESAMALDLEGITILPDGRVAMLSEGLGALVAENKILTEYPGPFSEFGGLGLEGVSSRTLEDGTARIIAVWEGGYPQADKFPLQLRSRVGEISLSPVMLMYNLPKQGEIGRVENEQLAVHEVRVPRPLGKEPHVQRFRIPDVVWHRYQRNGESQWCIIALLSSQNATKRPEYLYLWLQRFDLKGKPIEENLDLKKILPEELHKKNWEGMGWFEEGKSLVLTFDNSTGEELEAFVVDIPEKWK